MFRLSSSKFRIAIVCHSDVLDMAVSLTYIIPDLHMKLNKALTYVIRKFCGKLSFQYESDVCKLALGYRLHQVDSTIFDKGVPIGGQQCLKGEQRHPNALMS